MSASIWAALDPAASVGSAPAGFAETSTDPSRQTIAKGAPFWSPEHEHFGFGVTLLVTGALLFYVFEKGAGASVRGRVGRASAGADVGLEGAKGGESK